MDIVINWPAQVVATIFAMAVGALWYSPALFEKTWAKEVGLSEEKIKSANMPVQIIGSLILVFIFSVFLRFVVLGHATGEFATFGHGAFHGLFVALLVALPILGQKALFDQSGFKLLGINVGYWIVTLVGMCAILSGWQ